MNSLIRHIIYYKHESKVDRETEREGEKGGIYKVTLSIYLNYPLLAVHTPVLNVTEYCDVARYPGKNGAHFRTCDHVNSYIMYKLGG